MPEAPAPSSRPTKTKWYLRSGIAVVVLVALIVVGSAGTSAADKARTQRATLQTQLSAAQGKLKAAKVREETLIGTSTQLQDQVSTAQQLQQTAESNAKNAEARALRDAKVKLHSSQAALDSRTAAVAAREAAVTAAEGQLNASQFGGDGLYAVGTDIQPGTYFSAAPASGNCYTAVLTSPNTNDVGGIVTNNNTAGQSIVTVSAGQYLEVTGCDPFVKR
jgi:hypothetical protein